MVVGNTMYALKLKFQNFSSLNKNKEYVMLKNIEK